jgi:flavin reductase (DIM6/NTAB) family NADH-FMN oxidoreductase RutF
MGMRRTGFTEPSSGHPEPLKQDMLRDAFSMFPAGVTILSTMTPAGPHGTTVSAFASLSMQPAMVMTALAHTSTLLHHIQRSRLFAVNYLSAGQEDLAMSLASRNKDCTGLDWADLDGVPVLRGCSVVMTVRADRMQQAGDHCLISGHILGVEIADRASRPLIYHSRAFATLAPTGQTVA